MMSWIWFLIFCHAMLALLLVWNRARTTSPAPPDSPLPLPVPHVTVLIPARNEAANIGACLDGVLAQNYPRASLHVRVIDDRSTDATPQIVNSRAQHDARIELQSAPPLPPGWLGKAHALWSGVQGVRSEYLLFLDADVRLQPGAVRAAVLAAQSERAGLVTLVPRLLGESLWERAVQPVVALLLFAFIDPVKARNPQSPFAVGYGPFLFFSRTAYETLGGHLSVRTEIVEDLRLAQAVKAHNLGLAYVQGTDHVHLRMYDSLSALIAGWKKNVHIALGRGQWLAPLLAALLVAVIAGPALTLLITAVLYALFGAAYQGFVAWSLVALAVDCLARLTLHKQYGVPLRGLRSLGAVVLGYILCASSYASLRGRPVTWRGRSYPQDATPPLPDVLSLPRPPAEPVSQEPRKDQQAG